MNGMETINKLRKTCKEEKFQRFFQAVIAIMNTLKVELEG